jgi:hypothetical protein
MSLQENEGMELQRRMKDIRSKRIHRVTELHHEAERLVSWREYVRFAPISALIGTTALGFIAARTIARSELSSDKSPKPVSIVGIKPSADAPQQKGYIVSNALHMLTNVALTAGKMYLLRQLNAHSKSLKS